jgi:hypothetical protein
MLAPTTTARRRSVVLTSVSAHPNQGLPALIVESENTFDFPVCERDLCQRSLDTLADDPQIEGGGLGVEHFTGNRRLRQAGCRFHAASHLLTHAKSSLSWFCNGRFLARCARSSAIFAAYAL